MLHTLSNVCRDSLGGHGAAVVLAAVVGAAHEAARAVLVRVAVAAAQVAGGGGGAAPVLGLATHGEYSDEYSDEYSVFTTDLRPSVTVRVAAVGGGLRPRVHVSAVLVAAPQPCTVTA